MDKWLSGRYWVNMVAGRRPASMVASKEVGSDYSTVSPYEHAKTGYEYMKKQWGAQRPIKMQDRQALQPISYWLV